MIPRVWSQNQRLWRDLHAVSGFYGVLLIGFLYSYDLRQKVIQAIELDGIL
ncbi:MAG: hypothetical protein RMY16_31105 [Nostoc sp. DedQUE12b]|uniref:hypothetical protein n=1 Tax=Nostoc sp. DedQUE12b TaxID=3075398 RepID=UPI002AD574BA|nr:hypothetical protein [Nostoc sp. DedQUE12b]MDZ8089967.1 hypothetical protein [Nostoc sp. DedQUE12b]